MLMVVFGAGASHGSRPTGPDAEVELRQWAALAGRGRASRPPLTAGLFSEYLGVYATRYPASRAAIVRLRKALQLNPDALIEQEIGRLYEDAGSDPERVRHLLALRFYLSDLVETETVRWWEELHGFTHYAELLERLGTWRAKSGGRIILVTFNYDRLLDRSVESQVGNWKLTSFDSYVERSDWRLYKLHGSTGWSRVTKTHVERPDDPNNLIALADKLDLSRGEMRPSPWSEAVEESEVAVAVPGIAVPTNLKQTFECPDDHVRRFSDDIGEVQRLLTIGWRATEPHALHLLAERIRPSYQLGICDVGSHEIETIRGNLGLAARRCANPTGFMHGFTGLLESDALEQWLALPTPLSPS